MPPHLLPVAVKDERWYLHKILQTLKPLDDRGAMPMLSQSIRRHGSTSLL